VVVPASTTVVVGCQCQPSSSTSTVISWPLVGSMELIRPLRRVIWGMPRAHMAYTVGPSASSTRWGVGGPEKGIGDPDVAGGQVGVDQVGGGQGSQRRPRVQLQLGRQLVKHGEVRWASLGEKGAQQGPVERRQRAGQGGLTVLGPCGWEP
jgi:hypothetical protein